MSFPVGHVNSMKNPLRTLAMDRRNYDRVTTICLVLGVGAAIAHEPDSHLGWLSYAVAGVAALTAATLYFYRQMASSSAKFREPRGLLVTHWKTSPSARLVAEEEFDAIRERYLRAIADSFKSHDALCRDLELVLYRTIERQPTAKSIDRAKNSLRYIYSDLSPLLDSYPSDVDRTRDFLLYYLAAFAGSNVGRWPVPPFMIVKPKMPLPKHRASDSPGWIDHSMSEAFKRQRFFEGVAQETAR